MDLHLCRQLCNFSTCGTSEQTMGAPAAGAGLALAAVGFVGVCTRGLGQARVSAASTAPKAGPGTQLLQSWDLTSVDLCWWPCENNACKTPGLTARISTVEAGPMAVQQQCPL